MDARIILEHERTSKGIFQISCAWIFSHSCSYYNSIKPAANNFKWSIRSTKWPWATTNFRPYLHVLINSLKWNPLLFQQRNAFWRKTVDRMASLSSGICVMWNLTYKPQFSWKENDSSEIAFYSKVKWKLFFFPFFSLFNRTKFTDGSLRALKTLNVLDQQWELIQGLKKKARKIYLKQLQINLRKHHLAYNQGCGEEKNLHKWISFSDVMY